MSLTLAGAKLAALCEYGLYIGLVSNWLARGGLSEQTQPTTG